ncbi:MAG: hypothetical protein NVS3B6_12310 [Pseudarthrobacter sp.]
MRGALYLDYGIASFPWGPHFPSSPPLHRPADSRSRTDCNTYQRRGHFRSDAALDIDAVLISPDISVLKQNSFTVAALELTRDAVDVDQLAARNPERLALVLGTEGAGMSAETLAAVDLAVKIPMRAGVDSLNVAAASAVAFWELRRRSSQGPR